MTTVTTTPIHYHFDQLTTDQREAVDYAADRLLAVLRGAGVPIAGDDRAERVVDAIARGVLETADDSDGPRSRAPRPLPLELRCPAAGALRRFIGLDRLADAAARGEALSRDDAKLAAKRLQEAARMYDASLSHLRTDAPASVRTDLYEKWRACRLAEAHLLRRPAPF